MFKGIDISTYQSPKSINYDELAKQIDFVVLRVGFTGYGSNPPRSNNFNKDVDFERHYAEFSKRGTPIGVYWYGGAINLAEVDKELAIVKEALRGKKIEYPVYYDVEESRNHGTLSKDQLTVVTNDWCKKMEAMGYFTGIYASLHWVQSKLHTARLPYSLWIAQWGVSKVGHPCDLWQYTSDGKLKGYNGRLDMNIAYVDFKKIIAEAGLNHLSTAPTPSPVPPTPTPPTAGKFEIGQEVIINGTLYGTSMGANAGMTVTNRKTKITRYIAGHAKPYNTTGDLGWIGENQITPVSSAIAVGDKVLITGAGKAQASGKGGASGGIGWARHVLKIHKGQPYPYQVGNEKGTTGFYHGVSLKKL